MTCLMVTVAGVGCTTGPPSPPIALFAAPITAYAIGAAAAPIAFAQRHGPTITMLNRSDTPIDARFWVARVDVSKPAGYDDMHTSDRLTVRVQPNELLYTDVGTPGWVTGMNDALVWIRLIPASADDLENAPIIDGAPAVEGPASQRPAVEPTWLQFDRPGPYKIEIDGRFDPDAPHAGLTYRPLEKTSFKPLPRDSWVERHDGTRPGSTGS